MINPNYWRVNNEGKGNILIVPQFYERVMGMMPFSAIWLLRTAYTDRLIAQHGKSVAAGITVKLVFFLYVQ